MLNREELEFKNKILSIKDEKKLNEILNNGFINKHKILFIDKEIIEHVSKYAPYQENPEIGCYGFIKEK